MQGMKMCAQPKTENSVLACPPPKPKSNRQETAQALCQQQDKKNRVRTTKTSCEISDRRTARAWTAGARDITVHASARRAREKRNSRGNSGRLRGNVAVSRLPMSFVGW